MQRLALASFVLSLVACSPSEDPTDPVREVAVAPAVPVLTVVEPVQPMEVEESELIASSPAVEPVVDTVAAEPTPNLTRFELRRGETLAHFARWSERPVEDVATSSHLELDGSYPVGTEIALVVTDEERSILEARRDAHHQLRARNYLESRGSDRTEFYSVRTGDSAWTIAKNRIGMPVWLLESLNPSTDLDRLRPGQELLVPVFQDTVAQVVDEAPPEDARMPAADPEVAADTPPLSE